MLTQERVKELFDYQDGELIRKVAVCNCKKGSIAGRSKKNGYKEVGIDGVLYLNHRVIWLFHHGYFPENFIDHKDRIYGNGKIGNLREVSNQCNLRNTGNISSNKSGVKGVRYNKKRNKWNSMIVVNKKQLWLGSYACFTEAVSHRLAAEQCLDWSRCESLSPAQKYMQEYLEGKA